MITAILYNLFNLIGLHGEGLIVGILKLLGQI